MIKNIATAAALALALSTGAAMAAQSDQGPVKAPGSAGNLGVDISGAGTTTETRMAFWGKMTTDDQATVRTKCQDQSAQRTLKPEERDFCTDIMKQ
jgi:opacity protein-like surface antigen